MYHQAVSVAKGQEQKQVAVDYSRWIDTPDKALINLSNHFHHRIPAMPVKFHLMWFVVLVIFIIIHCQPC